MRAGVQIWCGFAGVVGATYVVLAALGFAPEESSRDAVSVLGASPRIGMISTFGYIGWGIAGTALVAAALGRRRSGNRHRAAYLVDVAALIAVLLIDDVLQIHEAVKRSGLPEATVYAVEFAGAVWIAARHAREILCDDIALLALSAASLSASVLIDVTSVVPIAAEDFPKYVGIGCLVAYGAREMLRGHEVAI